MKYELAKQLKDAGFDQETADYYIFPDGRIKNYFTGEQDAVTIPALEELIKACGDNLWSLQHSKKTEGFSHPGDWYVLSPLAQREPGNNPVFYSDTPEEAVANLWLELNKK